MMQKLFYSPLGQIVGYGIVTSTSMLMLIPQEAEKALGLLTVLPVWAITMGWVISTIAVTISTLAGAYKRMMEGRAAVMMASCTGEDCPYKQHWDDSHKKSQKEGHSCDH